MGFAKVGRMNFFWGEDGVFQMKEFRTTLTFCTFDRNRYYVLHCFGWIGVGITQYHPQNRVVQQDPPQWAYFRNSMVGESWNIVTTSRLSPCFLSAEVEFPSHEDGRRSDQRRFASPKKASHCSLHRPSKVMWRLFVKFLSCQLCQSNSVLIWLGCMVAGIKQNLMRHPSPELKRIAWHFCTSAVGCSHHEHQGIGLGTAITVPYDGSMVVTVPRSVISHSIAINSYAKSAEWEKGLGLLQVGPDGSRGIHEEVLSSLETCFW